MPALAYSFDGKNEVAQSMVDRYVRNYKWKIATQTRQAINDIVERSIREGIAPYDAARLIQESVGLDTRRTGALLAYRDKLVRDGRDFNFINRATDRYHSKLLRSRSRMIARTEVMGALNAGQTETFRQNDIVAKEWIVTPDELLCEICAPMAEEVVPVGALFSNGIENPPIHPSCRCTVGPATEEELRASQDPG